MGNLLLEPEVTVELYLTLTSLFTADTNKYNNMAAIEMHSKTHIWICYNSFTFLCAVLIHLYTSEPFISVLTLSTTGQKCIYSALTLTLEI